MMVIHEMIDCFKGLFRAGSVAPKRDSAGAQDHEHVKDIDE